MLPWMAILLLLPNVYGQNILWEKSIGGKQADYLVDVQPTADYGFILGGSSLSGKSAAKESDSNGDTDYWVWKMDEHGKAEWQKSFGGNGFDMLKSLQLTNDGGFILGGNSDSGRSETKKEECRGFSDFWIIKLNAIGGTEWEKTIGGVGSEDLTSIIQTTDGGYLLGGTSDSETSGEKQDHRGGSDFWVIKLSRSGEVQWQKTFGGKYQDKLTVLKEVGKDGFITGGWSNSSADGDKTQNCFGAGDFWILRLDKSGNIIWQKVFGGDHDDFLNDIVVVPDGFLIGGTTSSSSGNNKTKGNSNGTDFWLVQIGNDGEITWQETYDIGPRDLLVSITDNRDGSFLLSGHSRSGSLKNKLKKSGDSEDYVLIKINAKGEERWRKVVGSSGNDILKKSIETRDGGYLLAGMSSGAPSGDKKSQMGREDFWIVKLLDKDKKKATRQNIEAFPNPANDYTNVVVGYDFEKGTARLFDIGGHQLQEFEVTSRTIPIDLSNLADGIYIVQVATNISTDSEKIIKRNSK